MSKDALQRFIFLRPLAVMVRCIIQEILDDGLDAVFEGNRQRQYQREMLFSQLAISMADVVLGFEVSPHQAYKTHREDLRVSATCFYDKLRRVEPSISEAMVRYRGWTPPAPDHPRIVQSNEMFAHRKPCWR